MDQVGKLTNLTFLHLGRTQLTDEGLAKLHGLTNLKEIHVSNTEVSEEGIAAFKEAVPGANVVGGVF
jgi:hypothetical protein